MNINKIALLVAVAMIAVAARPQATGTQAERVAAPNPWSLLTREDLDKAIQVMMDDYPAPVDPERQGWATLADSAIGRAREQAKQVTSFDGYAAVLRRFAGSFQDEHFKIAINYAPLQIAWPRFLVGFKDHKYVVLISDNPAVKVESQVTTCDNVAVDSWVREKIIPYAEGVPSLEADVARDAPLLLVDDNNPFIKRPKQCVVDTQTVKLAWEPVASSSISTRITAAVLGSYQAAFQWHGFGAEGVWIEIPSFNPRIDRDLEAFRAIIRDAGSFRDKNLIVLDVRHNTGGNSEWFMRLLTSLYGEDMVRYYARAQTRVAVEYRVSPDNAANYAKLVDVEKSTFGAESDAEMQVVDALTHITQGIAQGAKTYLQPSDDQRHPWVPSPPPVNPIHGRVYVVTDYSCGSACLSFLDEMVRFPKVVQVGLPTHGDLPYANPLTTVLPSGLAVLRCATMIRRNRVRSDNQPWIPKYRFDGDIGDTHALESWIVQLNTEIRK